MANVLVIGQGGREHALAWALSRSVNVAQVFVAPGNGGTHWPAGSGDGLSPGAPSQNVPLASDDFASLVDFAQDNDVDLTVVGPEVPLAEGIVDHFQAVGLRIFGPSQAAAQIEASKAFAKDIMTEQGVPTGEFFTADDYDEARKFLNDYQKPIVVKASGLAAGKGVIIPANRAEAERVVSQMLIEGSFGAAGEIIVIEEQLRGKELSLLCLCDGRTAQPLLVARDYKRALDGDHGLNTGGMGAIAPADDVDPQLVADLVQTTVYPVLDAMNALETPYKGVLYVGVMLTEAGPKVLEYNCRFGDPETQVLLPLLKTDLYSLLLACVDGTLDQIDIEWHTGSAATVVCAAPGYPESYPKGLPITCLGEVQDSLVFQAGTKQADGQLVTDGGRVLAVTARGATLDSALERAYADVGRIHFDGMHHRKDIGALYE